MNPNAANCLLKTLEEPLARNHLVLCTSAPDRLLPTIRSRTQHVRFRPLSVAELLELARRHVHPRGARRDRGDAGRRIGGAPVRARRRRRRRRRGARRWRRCGRRSSRPATAPVFDFAAAQTSDKAGKAGKDDLGGCST